MGASGESGAGWEGQPGDLAPPRFFPQPSTTPILTFEDDSDDDRPPSSKSEHKPEPELKPKTKRERQPVASKHRKSSAPRVVHDTRVIEGGASGPNAVAFPNGSSLESARREAETGRQRKKRKADHAPTDSRENKASGAARVRGRRPQDRSAPSAARPRVVGQALNEPCSCRKHVSRVLSCLFALVNFCLWSFLFSFSVFTGKRVCVCWFEVVASMHC